MKYIVTRNGEVFSHKTKSDGSVRRLKLKTYELPSGYRFFRPMVGGKVGNVLVHRAVAKAYVLNESPAVRTQVNHKNGNKADNTWTNLEWCTPSENTAHSYNSGLHKRTGSIFLDSQSRKWTACIYLNGKRLRKQSFDKSVCEQWLNSIIINYTKESTNG